MSRKSVLTDMYNDGVVLSQNIEAKGEEYRERVSQRELIEEELMASFTDAQKNSLKSGKKLSSDMNSILMMRIIDKDFIWVFR